ncbi:MAG: fructosamine kinase family protein [Gammaproteobacteria bacterium]|nr:fructosamine kinase family protein [Gammaproteobacteria bacterium]
MARQERVEPRLNSLAAALSAATGRHVASGPESGVGGGSINECLRWPSREGPLFVKLAAVDRLPMFEAEADGLRELASAEAVRVPRVLGCGVGGDRAFLVLEWIESGRTSTRCEALLGEQLARQHRVVAGEFGWHRDNTIGSTPQHNDPDRDWVRFFTQRRLGFQLSLAARNGYGGRLTDRGALLCERVNAFFERYRPVPSLLHGDLWGGNWAADASGQPVIFDPAVYFGDREADIAMTRLFGGFGASFYAAYEAAWPLEPGADERCTLYNLYHVLNHLNLFGGGYLGQAQRMIDQLLV